MKRLSVVLSMVAVAALLLVSCRKPAPPAPTPTPVVAPTPGVKYGGILRIFEREDSPHWDVQGRHAYFFGMAGTVYNNLIRFDPQNPTEIVPDLAKRWEVSVDGKVITFFLQQGVKWHDGQPFTAADAAYTLTRMADPKRAAETAGGLKASFDRAEAVDDATLKVYFKQPSAAFLSILAAGLGGIQAKHIADNYDRKDVKRLVGTGPFKFKEYIPGVSASYVKNPDYWEKGKPYLDGVTVYFMPDEQAQVAAVLANRLDMSSPLRVDAVWKYDKYKANPNLVIDIAPTPVVHLIFGRFKPGSPWNEPRVRRAINLVIDRDGWALAGAGSTKFLHPGQYLQAGSKWALPWEQVRKMWGLDRPYEERVAEAQKLMADAGYGEGFKGDFVIDNFKYYLDVGSELGDRLKRHLKIDLRFAPMDEVEKAARLMKGEYMLAMNPIVAAAGDPSELLSPYVTGDSQNWTAYSNPKLDELFVKQEGTLNPEERVKVVNQIEEILIKDIPTIPGSWAARGAALWNYVRGYKFPGRLADNLRFDQVWFDK